MTTELTLNVPLRRLTRLLADMQTTINCAGLRAFSGDIDRFVIFSLIVREGLPASAPRPISAHSLSISLQRSFETVRRHINALIRDRYCTRVRGGVIVSPDISERPEIRALIRLSNDAFVRFVEDLAPSMPSMPANGSAIGYDQAIGVGGAVDVLLLTVDTNRGRHGDWLDLALFSTVLCANGQRHDRDIAKGAIVPLGERHAVRASLIARAMGLPETTVRRRVARLIDEQRTLVSCRGGLLVSREWLGTEDAAATTQTTLAGVRRELRKAVSRGFPIDAPAKAYLDGRPPAPSFA